MVRVWQKQGYRIEGQVEGRVNNQETTCEKSDLRLATKPNYRARDENSALRKLRRARIPTYVNPFWKTLSVV